jgi:methionyl aminopeptidase
MIVIKSSREIDKMRAVGKLAAETLEYLGNKVKPGLTTEQINDWCHEYTIEKGAIPATLNYHGFPKSLCTSPNEVVCHGIPSPKVKVKNGDILNLDVTSILNGWHGDTNRTFFVGTVSDEVKKLVKVTYQCMMAGIEEIKPGVRLGNIGAAIQAHAEPLGYSVVRDYCGHGIGRKFHEDPQVLHYGRKNTGVILKEGMIFTVEPMINLGTYECEVLEDDWTVITADGKWSAQFEHTVLVTSTGYEILTPWPTMDEFYLD